MVLAVKHHNGARGTVGERIACRGKRRHGQTLVERPNQGGRAAYALSDAVPQEREALVASPR